MGSFDQGFAYGGQLAERHTARQQQLVDEERQLKAKDFIDTRNGILTKLPTLLGPNGEKTPEYDQAFQQLTQVQQGLGQLYHPDKAPGALQKDWHFLLGKLHGITAPKGKTTPPPTAPQQPAVTPNTPAAPTGAVLSEPEKDASWKYGMQAPNTPGFGPNTAPSAPLFITQSFEGKPAPGMTSQGNIDLFKRPNIDNGDGTHSSTFSMSFGTDKGEVLVPGVGDGKTYPERQLRVLYTLPDGTQKWAVPGNQPHNWIAPERPTPQNNEALNQYQKTGKIFGVFEDEKSADAYGKKLHEDQEKYGNNGVTAHPVSKLGNVAHPATPSKPPAPSWGQAQVLKQRVASMQRAQQEAQLLASGTPLSPQQQAMSDYEASKAVQQKKIEDTLVTAKKLGFSDEEMTELKRQMLNLKPAAFKPLTGAAGQPQLGPDGKTFVQYGSDADGNVVARPVGAGYKPNTKAIRGTVIKTKDGKWYQTWIDPLHPSKIIGVQPFTPGRQYTGSTSSSSTTDPFGLTTSSSRSTTPSNQPAVDMDMTGIQQLPENYDGEELPENPTPAAQAPLSAPSGSPNKSAVPTAAPPASVAHTRAGVPQAQSPKTAATPTQLKSQVPAPPIASPSAPRGTLPLDSTGHIPTDAPYNKQIVGAANDLLDGKDLDKLPIPLKAKEAAETLARAYGWGGQGMFAPQQKLQIREASTFLNEAMNNPSMSVLDSWPSRQKLIAVIHNAEGDPGYIDSFLARNTNLNPKEAEFLRMFRQLTGTISGLASLTRPGRPTEAGIKRLMAELPNPNESHSAADGKERLKRLIKEIEIATQKGNADNLFSSSTSDDSNGSALDQFLQKKKGSK